MFVRRLKHKNGRTYVQVIDKSSGRYRVIKSFGSALSQDEVKSLSNQAKLWVKSQAGLVELDFNDEISLVHQLLDSISSHKLIGLELVLGKIFDDIGFNRIGDELFRDLVLYRLVYPKSKLKTTEYLHRYAGKSYSEDEVYRYMDKLYDGLKGEVQQISYNHTKSVLGDRVSVVFYDVTTVYFEIDQEDELRRTGFSKEGKHQKPQIVLGLLVSKNGYPLAYDVFEGNRFEGHTMLPVIDGFKKRYGVEQLVIVADSGLLSQNNIEELLHGGHEFILGARIKSETARVKNKILSLSLGDGESRIIPRGNLKLIISFSERRAKKDRFNRKKGLKRLEKRVKSGRLTKSNINNRGYNKYLKLEGDVKITIDEKKIEEDGQWDGLKGYITNAQLSKNEILENYAHLWQIEKAFRIAKTDLKIRPIYHRKQKRIEAHICLTFAAYKVYKELERQLKEKNSDLSPEKVIEIIQSIYQIEVITPETGQKIKKTLLMTDEHKQLGLLFDFGC